MKYLDFEESIQLIEEQLQGLIEANEDAKAIAEVEKALEKEIKKVYDALTPWQRVCLSRHPDRPYTLDYIKGLAGDTFMELHGDRNAGDDHALIGGLGKIGDQTYMFIGQQKGRNHKQRKHRRYGMVAPEGYRKALRLMKMAEKFRIPVLAFVDTPGAYPSIEAERSGQGEAIARNIFEQINLKTPIINVIIGEGASGGALGIGVGDVVLMLENAWYSVISPESCAVILWKDASFKEKAAGLLKLSSKDMSAAGFVDGVIREPNGGAHRDWNGIIEAVGKIVTKTHSELAVKPTEALLQARKGKYAKMAVYKEG